MVSLRVTATDAAHKTPPLPLITTQCPGQYIVIITDDGDDDDDDDD